MAQYAQATSVPVAKTLNEIDKLVTKYGANGFAYGRRYKEASVMFSIKSRMIRIGITQPEAEDYRRTPTGLQRSVNASNQFAEQEERRRWRAVLMVIKALLVGIDEGIIELEDAFLAYTVMPDNSTVGEWARRQLDTAFERGELPELLPGGRRAISS